MTDKKTREVATALSQNLISFHKGRHAFDADANKCFLVRYMVFENIF
jgi:hypothetical protein